MTIKECLEMIYVACTHYDFVITGKLGSEREYEGSYEQAHDIVSEELDKKDKKINYIFKYLTKMGFDNCCYECEKLHNCYQSSKILTECLKKYLYEQMEEDI